MAENLAGHALADLLKDLPFRKARVFKAANDGRAQRGKTLQIALKNGLDRGIGKTDQAKHDGVTADGVKLIGASEAYDVGLCVARAEEARDRVVHGAILPDVGRVR